MISKGDHKERVRTTTTTNHGPFIHCACKSQKNSMPMPRSVRVCVCVSVPTGTENILVGYLRHSLKTRNGGVNKPRSFGKTNCAHPKNDKKRRFDSGGKKHSSSNTNWEEKKNTYRHCSYAPCGCYRHQRLGPSRSISHAPLSYKTPPHRRAKNTYASSLAVGKTSHAKQHKNNTTSLLLCSARRIYFARATPGAFPM